MTSDVFKIMTYNSLIFFCDMKYVWNFRHVCWLQNMNRLFVDIYNINLYIDITTIYLQTFCLKMRERHQLSYEQVSCASIPQQFSIQFHGWQHVSSIRWMYQRKAGLICVALCLIYKAKLCLLKLWESSLCDSVTSKLLHLLHFNV